MAADNQLYFMLATWRQGVAASLLMSNLSAIFARCSIGLRWES